jgi:hypothetical protein
VVHGQRLITDDVFRTQGSRVALSSQKRWFRYHIPIPLAGFYDNGRFIVIGRGFGFTTQPRAGFMTTAYRQRTELGFFVRGLVPNHFPAVVAGQKSISADVKIGRRPGFGLGRSASSGARVNSMMPARNISSPLTDITSLVLSVESTGAYYGI